MKRSLALMMLPFLLPAIGIAQVNPGNKPVIPGNIHITGSIQDDLNKRFPVAASNLVTIPADKLKMYNDFWVTFSQPWENTMAAVEPIPGSNITGGRLVLSCGQNVPFPIATRSIFKADGTIDAAGSPATVNFPALDSASYGTDNQIVRLKDGSLLQMRNSNTWKALKDKPYWDSYIIYGKKANRGSTMFWRSTDNGDSWQLHSIIDFGEKALQKFAAPRPMNCKGDADVAIADQCTNPAKEKWWFGGGDRPELYVCPYTGIIYLTTRVIANLGTSDQHVDNYLLFYSGDKGKTWTLAKSDFPPYESMVMTSTPDGRLILFQEYGNAPTVYIAKFKLKPVIAYNPRPGEPSNTVLEVSQGYPVYYKQGAKPKSINFGTVKTLYCNFPDSLGSARTNRLGVGTADLARSSESKGDSSVVYASYQIRNDHNNQEICIIRIAFGPTNAEPSVSNVMRVMASDPASYSVMHGTFIQPDFIKTPAAVKSGLAMFYWIEAPRAGIAGAGANKFTINYMLIRNGHHTAPSMLTTKSSIDPAPRDIIMGGNIATGDYMRGGFFYYNGRYHFAPQWPENNGIHANIVSVDPDAIGF